MEIVRVGLPTFARELSHWPISQRIRSSAVQTGVGWPHCWQNAWMGVLAPQDEQTKRFFATLFLPGPTRYEQPIEAAAPVSTISSAALGVVLRFHVRNSLSDLQFRPTYPAAHTSPIGPKS